MAEETTMSCLIFIVYCVILSGINAKGAEI